MSHINFDSFHSELESISTTTTTTTTTNTSSSSQSVLQLLDPDEYDSIPGLMDAIALRLLTNHPIYRIEEMSFLPVNTLIDESSPARKLIREIEQKSKEHRRRHESMVIVWPLNCVISYYGLNDGGKYQWFVLHTPNFEENTNFYVKDPVELDYEKAKEVKQQGIKLWFNGKTWCFPARTNLNIVSQFVPDAWNLECHGKTYWYQSAYQNQEKDYLALARQIHANQFYTYSANEFSSHGLSLSCVIFLFVLMGLRESSRFGPNIFIDHDMLQYIATCYELTIEHLFDIFPPTIQNATDEKINNRHNSLKKLYRAIQADQEGQSWKHMIIKYFR